MSRAPVSPEQHKYGRDHGEEQTLGTIARRIAAAIDLGDMDYACDVIDREFLGGAWGHVLDESKFENILLNKDIRGLLVEMYKLGRRCP